MYSCASVGSTGHPLVALGSIGGQLKVYDYTMQAMVAEVDEAHSEAITVLDTLQSSCGVRILLSSSLSETKLWTIPSLRQDLTWPSLHAARFNLDGASSASTCSHHFWLHFW